MQEIILSFAVIGVFAIVFFVIFLLGKIAEFVDKRKAFEVGIQMTINRINDGFENLSGWKDRVKNCIEDHSKEVDKKIKEENEKQDKFYLQMFDKLAKLQEEINTEIKLSNIYGKQIDELVKVKKELETRIEVMEAMLEEMKDRIDKLSAIEDGEQNA